MSPVVIMMKSSPHAASHLSLSTPPLLTFIPLVAHELHLVVTYMHYLVVSRAQMQQLIFSPVT